MSVISSSEMIRRDVVDILFAIQKLLLQGYRPLLNRLVQMRIAARQRRNRKCQQQASLFLDDQTLRDIDVQRFDVDIDLQRFDVLTCQHARPTEHYGLMSSSRS